MDRNTIIGMVLIGVLLIGYSFITKPAREARMEEAQRVDSIAKLERARYDELLREKEVAQAAQLEALESDSARTQQMQQQLGDFAAVAEGEAEKVYLENEDLKIAFSTLGGRPYTVQLKQYQTHDSLPLLLMDGDSTVFALNFFADNRAINTGKLFFTPSIKKQVAEDGRTFQELTMEMDISETASIAYIYRLYDGDYMLDFDMRMRGLDQYRTDQVEFQFNLYAPSHEKGFQNESMYTNLYYKFKGASVESFKQRSRKDVEEVTETTKIEWVAFSQQFFSTILIAEDHFEGAYVFQEKFSDPGKYVRYYKSSLDIPFDRSSDELVPMKLYMGPNHFSSLKSYGDYDLQSVVTVGGPMIRWINAYAIIPIFNWLGRWIHNYGLIILILTLIIKTVLFPLTYRSYQSQAVMRVLKPQVDEINEKFPKQEDAMKKQQATMDLYKKAGANPMGGCLPMLLQFPILYAMFRFFPTSIELRQESFLWAHDLSTYDSILDLPWNIPLYGDHVSLFTILMTVTTVLSMRWNNQTTNTSAMPGMKTMMYMMPVMFMFILNNFSAGLTYYYFLANLITLGQNQIFKAFTDEEAILKKINSRKSKPKKKSRFAQRLEEMQKMQQGQQGGRKPANRKK